MWIIKFALVSTNVFLLLFFFSCLLIKVLCEMWIKKVQGLVHPGVEKCFLIALPLSFALVLLINFHCSTLQWCQKVRLRWEAIQCNSLRGGVTGFCADTQFREFIVGHFPKLSSKVSAFGIQSQIVNI